MFSSICFFKIAVTESVVTVCYVSIHNPMYSSEGGDCHDCQRIPHLMNGWKGNKILKASEMCGFPDWSPFCCCFLSVPEPLKEAVALLQCSYLRGCWLPAPAWSWMFWVLCSVPIFISVPSRVEEMLLSFNLTYMHVSTERTCYWWEISLSCGPILAILGTISQVN